MNDNAAPSASKPSVITTLNIVSRWLLLLPFIGILYAHVQWFVSVIPLVPILPLVIVLFLTGILPKDMAKAGIPLSGFWLRLIAGTIILYFSWATWLNLLENFSRIADWGLDVKVSHITIPGMLRLLSHPQEMWTLMTAVNKVGTWGLAEGWIVTGIPLWICWILDALIIYGSIGQKMGDFSDLQKENPATAGSPKR